MQEKTHRAFPIHSQEQVAVKINATVLTFGGSGTSNDAVVSVLGGVR